MTNKLFQDLVSAGRVLLEVTFVQYFLVIGVCILLYYITFDEIWLDIALLYTFVIAMILGIRANRRTGGHRGTSNGPAGGPVDFGGGGNGGGNGGGGNGG